MLWLIFGGRGQDRITVPLSFTQASSLHVWLAKKLAQLNPDSTNPAHAALAVERSRSTNGH